MKLQQQTCWADHDSKSFMSLFLLIKDQQDELTVKKKKMKKKYDLKIYVNSTDCCQHTLSNHFNNNEFYIYSDNYTYACNLCHHHQQNKSDASVIIKEINKLLNHFNADQSAMIKSHSFMQSYQLCSSVISLIMIINLINMPASATTSTLRRVSFLITVKICSYSIHSSVSQYLTSSYLLILTFITSSLCNNIVIMFLRLSQFILLNLVFMQSFTHYSLFTYFRILIHSLHLTLQSMFNSSFTADFL